MVAPLSVSEGTREEKYRQLLPQIAALVEGESDFIANCANVVAAVKQHMGFLWVGVYFAKNNDELVLGPFQGAVACTRIRLGEGVCGTAWKDRRTVVVADVEQFEGHIACSALSRSEIVVPMIKSGVVVGVLDVDSDQYGDFSAVDQRYLEQLVSSIMQLVP